METSPGSITCKPEDWTFWFAPSDPVHLSLACSVPWELTSTAWLGMGSASSLRVSEGPCPAPA